VKPRLTRCVFTTRLELILSEIPERNQPLRPAAVPQDGTPRGKIAFTIFDLRAPPKNSSKRKRQFFRSALSSTFRAGRRGFASAVKNFCG
jgi:hypothetical protein